MKTKKRDFNTILTNLFEIAEPQTPSYTKNIPKLSAVHCEKEVFFNHYYSTEPKVTFADLRRKIDAVERARIASVKDIRRFIDISTVPEIDDKSSTMNYKRKDVKRLDLFIKRKLEKYSKFAERFHKECKQLNEWLTGFEDYQKEITTQCAKLQSADDPQHIPIVYDAAEMMEVAWTKILNIENQLDIVKEVAEDFNFFRMTTLQELVNMDIEKTETENGTQSETSTLVNDEDYRNGKSPISSKSSPNSSKSSFRKV